MQRPLIEYLAAEPGRPFSAGVRVGDVLYLSGQLGMQGDGTLADGFAAQVRQTMDNICATLEAVGLSMADVFKSTVMLADMARWDEFNAVYLEYFAEGHLPARSAFGADGLAFGADVEVECWAYVPGPGSISRALLA